MAAKARLVGINHVALEVGDLDAALDLSGGCSASSCAAASAGWRSSTWATSSLRSPRAAPSRPTTTGTSAWSSTTSTPRVRPWPRPGLRVLGGRGQSFDFRDPWGNRFQVVGYGNIQFERTDGVRRKLGIEGIGKTDAARREIADRGLHDDLPRGLAGAPGPLRLAADRRPPRGGERARHVHRLPARAHRRGADVLARDGRRRRFPDSPTRAACRVRAGRRRRRDRVPELRRQRHVQEPRQRARQPEGRAAVHALDRPAAADPRSGTASLHHDDPLLAEWEGAQLVVRVQAKRIFLNCPRYLHRWELTDTRSTRRGPATSRRCPTGGCARSTARRCPSATGKRSTRAASESEHELPVLLGEVLAELLARLLADEAEARALVDPAGGAERAVRPQRARAGSRPRARRRRTRRRGRSRRPSRARPARRAAGAAARSRRRCARRRSSRPDDRRPRRSRPPRGRGRCPRRSRPRPARRAPRTPCPTRLGVERAVAMDDPAEVAGRGGRRTNPGRPGPPSRTSQIVPIAASRRRWSPSSSSSRSAPISAAERSSSVSYAARPAAVSSSRWRRPSSGERSRATRSCASSRASSRLR